MTTPKITGNEPYYPTTAENSLSQGLLAFGVGITIKQKFIADHMRELSIKMCSPKDPTNWDAIEKESEAAFKSYLKIINGE